MTIALFILLSLAVVVAVVLFIRCARQSASETISRPSKVDSLNDFAESSTLMSRECEFSRR